MAPSLVFPQWPGLPVGVKFDPSDAELSAETRNDTCLSKSLFRRSRNVEGLLAGKMCLWIQYALFVVHLGKIGVYHDGKSNWVMHQYYLGDDGDKHDGECVVPIQQQKQTEKNGDSLMTE
ncbi:hypothetical protein GQ457_06G041170 [Hibiscus cannabinus]